MTARWTRRQSGDDRITLHVAHHLSFDELSRVLAHARDAFGFDLTAASVVQLRTEVRDLLDSYGNSMIIDVNADDESDAATARAFGMPS